MDFPGPRAYERLANLATARVLAVTGLIVMTLAVAGITIVSVESWDEGSDNGTSAIASDCTPGAEKAVESGYYVLKAGEGLNDVSDKTCVGVDRIERLSPSLDPQALPLRGCIDLIKRGCKALATES
jgi:hypothetical protein